MKPLSYTIAGCGGFSLGNFPAMKAAEGWELVGLADPDEANLKRMQAETSLSDDRVYADDRALYDQVVPDVAFVHSPVQIHYQNCKNALEAGCHVCCQKPFVHDLSLGVELIELAERKGTWISIGQTMRVEAVPNAVMNLIKQGKIGTPRFGHHTGYRNRMKAAQTEYVRKEPWPCIYVEGIHSIDLFSTFFNERISRVSFRGIECDWNPYEYPGAVTGWIEFDGGQVINYFRSYVSKVPMGEGFHPYEDYMLQGDRGAVHWRGPWSSGPVELLVGDAEKPECIYEGGEGDIRSLTAIMGLLAKTIHEGAPLFCPAEENLWVLAGLFAAEHSAEQGGVIVDVKPFAAERGFESV